MKRVIVDDRDEYYICDRNKLLDFLHDNGWKKEKIMPDGRELYRENKDPNFSIYDEVDFRRSSEDADLTDKDWSAPAFRLQGDGETWLLDPPNFRQGKPK